MIRRCMWSSGWRGRAGHFLMFNNPWLLINYCMQGKCWSKQEDQLLKHLFEEKSVKKWSIIATRINKTFEYSNKSGKQCRQRYHNSLAPFIVKKEWTPEEEQELFRLHDELGNKWTEIAGKLPGRAHNCVKNRFYAEVRKSLRRINRWQKELKIKSVKVIRVEGIIKILYLGFKNCTEPEPYCTLSKKCLEIKNKILFFNRHDPSEPTLRQEIVELYKAISTLAGELRSYRLGKTKTLEKEKEIEKDEDIKIQQFSDKSSSPCNLKKESKQPKSSQKNIKIEDEPKEGGFMVNSMQNSFLPSLSGGFSFPMYPSYNGFDYYGGMPFANYYFQTNYTFNQTDGAYQEPRQQ